MNSIQQAVLDPNSASTPETTNMTRTLEMAVIWYQNYLECKELEYIGAAETYRTETIVLLSSALERLKEL